MYLTVITWKCVPVYKYHTPREKMNKKEKTKEKREETKKSALQREKV